MIIINNFAPIINTNGTVDFIGKQGATWVVVIGVKKKETQEKFPLTGYIARGQIRTSYDSLTVVADFECSINIESGEVTAVVTHDKTALIIPCKTSVTKENRHLFKGTGVYVYDIEIESDTNVSRIVEGKIYVDPEVTKNV